MITPEFLKSCTDEQINKGVAWLEVSEFSLAAPDEQGFIDYHCAITMLTRTPDYCNSPNDAWPIVQGNRIILEPCSFCKNKWWARGGAFHYRQEDNSWFDFNTSGEAPLRAAMEVYILMSTAK